MNRYQRIILIIGAIVFVIALLSTPRVFTWRGTLMKYSIVSDKDSSYAPLIPTQNATVRGIAVFGATAMLWFAAKRINSKKE